MKAKWAALSAAEKLQIRRSPRHPEVETAENWAAWQRQVEAMIAHEKDTMAAFDSPEAMEIRIRDGKAFTTEEWDKLVMTCNDAQRHRLYEAVVAKTFELLSPDKVKPH